MTAIVFDIGGTNTRVAHTDEKEALTISKYPTPRDSEAGVRTLIESIQTAADGEPVSAIAGGMAGVIDAHGRVLHSPNLATWDGVAIGERLRTHFGCEGYVRNDTDMSALGEAVYGAGAGARITAFISIGTGVGGSRIVDGHIDAYALGFEPGHQIVDAAAGATLESIVGGDAVAARTGAHPKDAGEEVYAALTPTLAAGLCNTIVHWSPDVLVLGGSMMNESNGFRIAHIRRAIEALPQIFPVLPQITAAQHADASVLVGARAYLESLAGAA